MIRSGWQTIGNRTVESVTSPWDQKTCRADIKPILIADKGSEVSRAIFAFPPVLSGAE